MIKIAFVGNPNVGKSALINDIAGSKLRIGNWPGVTVEKKEADFTYKGEKVKLVDLPGVYSLSPYTLEEKIARDYVFAEKPDVIINVLDSTNLERNLYLTLLLKELGKPMILALNFYDEFEKLGHSLNIELFSKLMEIDVVKTVAIKGTGINELMEKAYDSSKKHSEQQHIKYELTFDGIIEKEICKVKRKIENLSQSKELISKYTLDWLAIKNLEKDHYLSEKIEEEFGFSLEPLAEETNELLKKDFREEPAVLFDEARYGVIKSILKRSLKSSLKSRLAISDKIDNIVLNKFFSIPIFLFLIYFVFVFTFEGSAPLIGWVEGFIGFVAKYLNKLLEGVPGPLQSMIMDGIFEGVGSVLTFVPLMMIMFLFLALLEECGYMARVAFIMDRIMNKIGLNGKAFLPLVVGFGCNVPAIYATRTLENEEDKRLTAAIAPLISCGARLPVYALFTAAFFAKNQAQVVLILYLLGIFIAILLGLVLKKHKTFFSQHEILLIELPPYRIPTVKMLWASVAYRTKGYIKKAGTVIMLAMVVLWAFMNIPYGASAEDSILGKTAKVIAPIFKTAGFGHSWEAVASTFPGIVAKEIVVGFLGQSFGIDEDNDNAEEIEYNFFKDFYEQAKDLFIALFDSIKSILKFQTEAFSLDDQQDSRLLIKLQDTFTPLQGFSFMVFILLMVPCVGVLGALKQEFGWKFMFFEIGLLMFVPWLVSSIIYQFGRLLGF